MSFTTILGVLFGFGLFIGSVVLSTNNYLVFLNLPSFVMVIGGTLAATFIAYEPRYVLLSLKQIWRIVMAPKAARGALMGEVGRIIRWAYVVQKGGLPALEQEAAKLRGQDTFITYGVELVVSNYSGDEVREFLSNMVETTFGRNTVQADILRSMGATAPAFGMIGTLVGLIIMLQNMGGDITQLGGGLAIALITTLYGVLFARLVFMPTASKLQQREEILRFRNYLMTEGLSMLAERKSPRFIQDKMNSFLDPAIHFNIDQQMRGKEKVA